MTLCQYGKLDCLKATYRHRLDGGCMIAQGFSTPNPTHRPKSLTFLVNPKA